MAEPQTFEHGGRTYAVGETNDNGDAMGPRGHFLTQCKSCPAPDDDPKHHYGPDTYHYDCLPPYAEQDVTRHASTHPQHAANARIIAAARGGTRGQELRSHIAEQDDAVTKPALETFHASIGLLGAPPLADINEMHRANVAAGREAFAAPVQEG